MTSSTTVKEILKKLNIELKDQVKKILEPLKDDKDYYSLKFLKLLFSSNLDSIIKKGSFPLDVHKLNIEPLKGVHLVQLLEAEDIATSKGKERFYFNSKIEKVKNININTPGPKRMLKLVFTDGETIFVAMEFRKMPELDEFVDYWCSLKDKLIDKEYSEIESIQILALLSGEPIIRRGIVMLLPGMLTFIKLKTEIIEKIKNGANNFDFNDDNKKKVILVSNKPIKNRKKNVKVVANDSIDIRSYTNFNLTRSESNLITNVNNKPSNSYFETEFETLNYDKENSNYPKDSVTSDTANFTSNSIDSPSQSSVVLVDEYEYENDITQNEENLVCKSMSKLESEIEEMELTEAENKSHNFSSEENSREELFEDFQGIYNEYGYIDEFETFEERMIRDAIENDFVPLIDKNENFLVEDNEMENSSEGDTNGVLYCNNGISNENEEIIWVEGAVLTSELSSENEIILELGIHYPKSFPTPWNELINEQVFLNLELAKKILCVYDNEENNKNRLIADMLLAYVRFVQGTICLKLVDSESIIKDKKTKKSKVYFVGLIPFSNDSDYILNYLNTLERNELVND
ncbi:hypothetical protein FG379_003287 [Cryptosporidium bovis]|uniref:uncharacterized protein n=1 Tax=Cryptosporidium bovis TaxID=310047 RepID=UPI00351A6B13|nr:hypothetical protein FG379_003287 [Cryptosporidium bovis]